MKKVIMVLLVLLLLGLLAIRGARFYEDYKNEQKRTELTERYEKAVTGEIDTKNKNQETAVLGEITIPSLQINYVILDGATDENLDISITKVTGPNMNKTGNLVLAGHNMRNGSLFGKLKKATKKDTIFLTDDKGNKAEYSITKMYTVKDTNLTPLAQNTNGTKLTLITCTDNNENRLIVVAEKTAD
ncbi:sortase [Niallia circulans]|uniref:Sortase n=1 Tax=Niallia circulans TaxID=1397 RepID=A0A553SJ84_NIACI|nr:sortase [Niallia circulans]TRZ37046.1 sortase [Niallia circulans]